MAVGAAAQRAAPVDPSRDPERHAHPRGRVGGGVVTRADLAHIARTGATPETRRAAAAVLEALDALDIRLALDAGCARHERPDGADAVVATLGPAPQVAR